MKNFTLIILVISLLGLLLRLYKYDKVPSQPDTQDEVMYAWAGQSFLTTGTPKSWTVEIYEYPKVEEVIYNGITFNVVSPWVEKPPIYSLLSGATVVLAGERNLTDVTLATIRLLPILLGTFTIVLTAYLAKSFFSEPIAYLSAILYASIPPIVIGNRLSVAESLITPLSLITIILIRSKFPTKWSIFRVLLIALSCGLSILTRQSGIALAASAVITLFILKEKKWAILISLSSLLFFVVYPSIGLLMGGEVFFNVISKIQTSYTQGAPDFLAALFKYQVITQINKPFFDGTILLGYVLLFSSPFWLKDKIFSIFPLVFIFFLALMETGTIFYGWHLFPIFPFLAILVSYAFYSFYKDTDIKKALVLAIFIALPAVKTYVNLEKDMLPNWQPILLFALLVLCLTSIFKSRNIKLVWLLILFGVYIFLNCQTVLKPEIFYPF